MRTVIKTDKLHQRDPFLCECSAVVLDVSDKGIVTDRTIAFAEGGGQIGDQGWFIIDGRESPIRFQDTQKGLGRTLLVRDFPTIQVDNPVYHEVAEEDLDCFKVSMPVRIRIDAKRRGLITAYHSGIHLILIGVEKLYPEMVRYIKGAHITDEQARLDFAKLRSFTESDLSFIQDYANQIVERDEKISVFTHTDEPEALYWRCGESIYPCGGTHLPSTGLVGKILVKRKGMGRKLERLIGVFPEARPPMELYYEE